MEIALLLVALAAAVSVISYLRITRASTAEASSKKTLAIEAATDSADPVPHGPRDIIVYADVSIERDVPVPGRFDVQFPTSEGPLQGEQTWPLGHIVGSLIENTNDMRERWWTGARAASQLAEPALSTVRDWYAGFIEGTDMRNDVDRWLCDTMDQQTDARARNFLRGALLEWPAKDNRKYFESPEAQDRDVVQWYGVQDQPLQRYSYSTRLADAAAAVAGAAPTDDDLWIVGRALGALEPDAADKALQVVLAAVKNSQHRTKIKKWTMEALEDDGRNRNAPSVLDGEARRPPARNRTRAPDSSAGGES